MFTKNGVPWQEAVARINRVQQFLKNKPSENSSKIARANTKFMFIDLFTYKNLLIVFFYFLLHKNK